MGTIAVFSSLPQVAPYAGAWIEIGQPPPARSDPAVAPYAGAWIEISDLGISHQETCCRSLRGSVD